MFCTKVHKMKKKEAIKCSKSSSLKKSLQISSCQSPFGFSIFRIKPPMFSIDIPIRITFVHLQIL